MNKLNKWVTQIFLYLSIFGILVLFSEHWGAFSKLLQFKVFNMIMNFCFPAWIISASWFFLLLIFNHKSREYLLARLANLQERDEREEQIVGWASKRTFLFMLAVLLALFVASTIHYGRGMQNPGDNKFHTLNLGNGGLFENRSDVTTIYDGKRTEQIEVHELLPLSKTGLLLVLIIVLIVSYQVSAGAALGSRKVPMSLIAFLGLLIVTGVNFMPQYTTWDSYSSLLTQADQGDQIAQNRVGEMLLFGQGVKQDFQAALQWFLKSSSQGNAVAANHLGRLYLNGEGVARNVPEACKWYKFSAEHGDSAGLKNSEWCKSRDAKNQ